MINRNFTRLGIGSFLVLFTFQLLGHGSPKGNEPSIVYSSLAAEQKDFSPARMRGKDWVGVIKDASGTPIRGATVFVYTAKPRVGRSSYCPSCYADCGKHEETNADGVFRIPSLAENLIFRVLVVKDGFEPLFVLNVDPLRGKSNISLKKTIITPEQKKRLVRGRVLDPLGTPVVGAIIAPLAFKPRVGSINESFGQLPGLARLAITNQRGEFHFLSPSAGNSVRIRVRARGLAATNFVDLISGSTSPSTLNLPWGVTVTGTVSSDSGKKVSGVVVKASPIDLSSEKYTGWVDATTDNAGKFILYNVPAESDFSVSVNMDSLSKSNRWTVPQMITTGHNDTTMEDVNLTTQSAAILSGQVVLMDGKKPPKGTHVILGRDGVGNAQQTILSATGKFTFQGVPQKEVVSLYVRVLGYRWADGTPLRKTFRTQIPLATAKKVVLLSLAPDVK